MKITKEQLKRIIKEEIESLEELSLNPVVGPPGASIDDPLGTALQDVPPTDEEASRQRIIDELNAEVEDLIASGLDPLTAYGTVLQSPQNQGAVKRSGW